MKTLISRHGAWLVPILAMLIITPFTPLLDLTLAGYFYQPETQSFSHHAFFIFIFNYGSLPGILTCVFASIIVLITYYNHSKLPWRSPALLLSLSMIIGSGLIVNLILKDHWGRPRPRQIIEFGGHQAFRAYYEPNFFHQTEKSKSFPSGHASTGFYFFAVAVLGMRFKSRSLFWIGMVLAFGLGGMLSLTRIAMGGHFFSDTLIAALIMWLTAYFCDQLIFERNDERPNKKTT